MNLKSLATLSGVFFVLLLFIAGCQQEDQVTPGSQLSYRGRPSGIPDQCLPNLPTWSFNDPCAGDDLTVTVCFNADCGQAQIQQFIAGMWVQVSQENPLTGSCLSVTIAGAAAGTYDFRTHYQSSGGSCNFCAVNWEGANETPNSHYSATVQECDDEVCYGPGESAWSDGPEYAEGHQWATYTAAGNLPATLYAGQTMNAGTVSYAGGMITITLAAGWEFADVAENVKIQGYASAPTEEPSPGQFSNKTTAAQGSSPYSVAQAAANYYGVHVDLVPIVECPE